jgi:hypothetical protein
VTPAPDRREQRRRFDADQRALRVLYERHRESVFAAALLVTQDPLAAGLITRRAFTRLWQGRDDLPPELAHRTSARRWLVDVAQADAEQQHDGARRSPAR